MSQANHVRDIALRPRTRVLLFTDSFIHGGTERQFVQALGLLDRNRFELFAGCLKKRGPFLSRVEALGMPIVEFPIRSLVGVDTARWFFRLVDFLRTERIDIVHAFDFYTAVFAVPAARWAGVPIVLASRRELAGDRTLWQRQAIRMACSLSTGIVANSRAAGSRLIGWSRSAASRVTVVPNCLDLEEFRATRPPAEVRASLGVPATAPLVGILGALRMEKDHATFLRAAARVAAELPEARFLLVGDGPQRAALEALAQELNIAGRVLFAGDRNDVADLLASLDVFVLSSSTESFPNAILEAMAMERAVVATRVGGIPELVEEGMTGFLVPVSDATAMAGRIAELLRDAALRRAMGRAGRERVEKEFTPQRMKQRLEELYARQLREQRPVGRVLQIGNYPPPVCGWSLHTQLVDRELRARGVDARVMDIGPGRRIAGRDCETVLGGFDFARKLLRYRRRGFTFHVHLNGDSWKGYLLALFPALLGRLTGKPAIVTFHAGPRQIYFPRSRGAWRRAFQLLFRAAGEIICNHEPVRKVIATYGVSEQKIHPIPAYSVQYAEDLPVPLPPAVESFLTAHAPRLFSYSLFRPEFTMEALFDAFAAVRREFPGAGLLIAGPQEVPPDAQEQIHRLGLESCVLIPGNLPHAQFLTVVQRSDVFVRTHLRDGVCSSVLEALQLGVPVVAAEDGIRPPSVVTYAPGDADDLRKKLSEVLSDLSSARGRVRPPDVENHLEREIALILSVAAPGESAAVSSEARA
jgi:glycosyltransferase involved in cell wall biosynthesis